MTEVKKNLYVKLNEIRLELSKEMNKSGKNNYSKYDYFQLKDFMPKAIEKCNELGLFTKFWIDKEKVELPTKKTTQYIFDDNGEKSGEIVTEEENFKYVEYAYLQILDTDSDEELLFQKETADCNLSGAQPIQNLGGKTTYMKRYMYMDVFEINESDKVEEATGKPIKVETKATTTKKPVVKKVETKSVEPVVDIKSEVTPVVEEKSEKTSDSVNTEDLMSMETKIMIAGKIKEIGLDPRTEIVEFAKELGTDVPLLKESDKDKILEILENKASK